MPEFKLCGASLDLIKDHQQLISDIRSQSATPGAVVIDTMNRSLLGSESSDEDMAAYLKAANAIEEVFGCAVIIIHHRGTDDKRPRGHSSQSGAADVQIAVKKDTSDIVIATVEYAKDMADGTIFASCLEVVELGTDQDGDQKTTCVVVRSRLHRMSRSNIRRQANPDGPPSRRKSQRRCRQPCGRSAKLSTRWVPMRPRPTTSQKDESCDGRAVAR